MKAVIMDGGKLAEKIRSSLIPRVAAFRKSAGRPPRLAIVAGRDPAAQAYLRAKTKACGETGIETFACALGPRASTNDAIRLVQRLNGDASLDAILVASPLPAGLRADAVQAILAPEKDVEGVAPANYGRFFLAKSYKELASPRLIAPCTAMAVVRLLLEAKIRVAGKEAVVVGRSAILGRPAAHLLSALDATVTLAHSRTKDLPAVLRRADVIVAALGKPRFIRGSWLKPGSVVIDAGINAEGKSLIGDVDFASAAEVASFITPVPGGVGPVTTAILLENAITLAERRHGS